MRKNVDASLDEGMPIPQLIAHHKLTPDIVDSHIEHWKNSRALQSALRTNARAQAAQPAEKRDRGRPPLTPDQILGKASDIIYSAEELFEAAKDAGIVKDAVHALEAVRRSIELLAKFHGMGQPGPQTVVDQRQVTVLQTLDKLTLEEMRAIAYGRPLAELPVVREVLPAMGEAVASASVPGVIASAPTYVAEVEIELDDSEPDDDSAEVEALPPAAPPAPVVLRKDGKVIGPFIAVCLRAPDYDKPFERSFLRESELTRWLNRKRDHVKLVEYFPASERDA